MRGLFILWAVLWVATNLQGTLSSGHQPLSKIAIHRTKVALDDKAYVTVSPSLLGLGVNVNNLAHLISLFQKYKP